MHTVKFTKKAYLVLDSDGATVATYPFDAFDFHGSRRPAYRAALEDAAARDEADEKALVTALIEGCDACDAPVTAETFVAEIGLEIAAAMIDARNEALGLTPVFEWRGTAREWLAMREAA